MPNRQLIRIALRNLVRHARQSAFALAAIVFGVMGLALADGFIRDVFHQLGEATVRGQLGHLQVTRPGFREAGVSRPEDFLIERPGLVREALAGDPRVASVTGRLHLSGLLSAGSREVPVEIEGAEPVPDESAGAYLKLLDGVALAEAGGFATLLGEGVARQLGLKVGDFANLTAATLDGSLNAIELEVAGIFRTFSKDYDDRVIRIGLAQAQELAQAGGVNAVVLHLHRTEDTDAVLAELRANAALAGLEARPWYELSDFYESTRELYARQFGILQGIALLLIAMSVLTSSNITVFERTGEFGTMRALGARSTAVIRLIVYESAALGVLGAALGVVLALLGGWLISSIGIPMPPPPNAEAGFTARILVTPGALASAAVVGIVSSIVGALLPSFRVGRLPVVEALRQRI